jgi:hypothetical protein
MMDANSARKLLEAAHTGHLLAQRQANAPDKPEMAEQTAHDSLRTEFEAACVNIASSRLNLALDDKGVVDFRRTANGEYALPQLEVAWAGFLLGVRFQGKRAAQATASAFSDQQLAAMSNCKMSQPIALEQADLEQSFVYERRLGLFYVPKASHQMAMSLLLAFQHSMTSGEEVASALGVDYPCGSADHWLEHTPGAAFKSSAGARIQVARFRQLSPVERRLFIGADRVFER